MSLLRSIKPTIIKLRHNQNHIERDNVTTMAMSMDCDLLLQDMNDVADHQHRSGNAIGHVATAPLNHEHSSIMACLKSVQSSDSSTSVTDETLSLLLHKNSHLGIQQLFCPRTKQLVDTGAALRGKTVLYYFSAAWCKPCKQFTPLLIEWYQRMVMGPSQQQVEVVFVSADHMRFNFDEYTQHMPWLCVPFKDAYYKRGDFMSLYRVEGIPQVIIVSPDGEALNWDATAAIAEDPTGRNFPWRRQSLEDLLQGQYFIMPLPPTPNPNLDANTYTNMMENFFGENNHDNYSISNLTDKYLILYFCASWCEACVDFTPLLSDTYQTLKAQRADVEVRDSKIDLYGTVLHWLIARRSTVDSCLTCFFLAFPLSSWSCSYSDR
jgi:thiol-disulfide isomerase/thioredoxin